MNVEQMNLIFTKEFRRMSDKTQMFTTNSGPNYRTRLTHTNEVFVISTKILVGAEKRVREYFQNKKKRKKYFEKDRKLNSYTDKILGNLSRDIVQTIALLHDIGHTPFGHVGEEALDNVLSSSNGSDIKHHFKHNINSGKIVLEKLYPFLTNHRDGELSLLERKRLKILDGIIKHTSSFKEKGRYRPDFNNQADFYNMNKLFTNLLTEREIKEIESNVTLYKQVRVKANDNDFEEKLLKDKYTSIPSLFLDKYLVCNYAFYGEGQIVSIADEISQRVSDLDDSIRYYKNNHKYVKENYIEILLNVLSRIMTYFELYIDKKENLIRSFESDKIDVFFNSVPKAKGYEGDERYASNRRYRFIYNLRNDISDINEIIKKDSFESNLEINTLQQEILRNTMGFYVKDVREEFVRELLGQQIPIRNNKPLWFDKKFHQPVVRFSMEVEFIAKILNEFNYRYVINAEKTSTIDKLDPKFSSFETISDSNSEGVKLINNAYETLYKQPSRLTNDELISLINKLLDKTNSILQELEYRDTGYLDFKKCKRFLMCNDIDEFAKIMHKINQRERNYNTDNHNELETLYTQELVYVIAGMSNSFMQKVFGL